VSVAAAADLRYALPDVVKEFERRNLDIRVEVAYGASGQFYAQLSQQAPFDLFLSADVDYPRRLIKEGLARKADEFVYGIGHLVLWVPPDSPIDVEKLGRRALMHRSVKKIALADPRVAPYGRAAEAALRKWKVYDQVEDRLAVGESVGQAAQFVQSGNAQIGLIPQSLARAPALRDGRFWEIPPEAYPRLQQAGIILSRAQDAEAARALRTFLTGTEGRAILKRYGFTVPEN
jgi:molybdate transport system substrate-binding protein